MVRQAFTHSSSYQSNAGVLHWLPSTLILGTAACTVDLSLALGYAGGFPYLLATLNALRARRPQPVAVVAAVSSILILFGYFASPPPADASVLGLARLNRVLTLAGVWSIGMYALIKSRRAHAESVGSFLPRPRTSLPSLIALAWGGAAAALLATLLVIDLMLPLGYAGGVPYVTATVLGMPARRSCLVLVLASLSSLLIAFGYFASPPAADESVLVLARINRVLALGGVWLTAILVLKQQRLRRHLERRLEQQQSLAEVAWRCLSAESVEEITELVSRRCGERATNGCQRAFAARPQQHTDVAALGANWLGPESYTDDDELHLQSMRNVAAVGCERIQRGKAIGVSEARFRAIFENAGVGIFVLDTENRIRDANGPFCVLAGGAAEDLQGRTLTEVLSLEPCAELENLFDEPRCTAIETECRFRRTDETSALAHFKISIVRDQQGHAVLAVGLVEDITESRRAQEVIRGRLHELAHVARVHTADGVASEIVHEVGQPLAAIANYIQVCLRLLERQPANRDVERSTNLLSRALGQADRVSTLITRVRKSIRRSEPRLEPVELNDLIRELLELFELEAQRCEANICFLPQQGLPTVQADRVQIEQVLANLLRNALEALESCHPGRRRIVIRTGLSHSNSVCVHIEDTGHGVPRPHLERLFDPYFTTKPDGMGLGLYLSKAILELHDGQISVESAEGQGTAFHVRLPIEGRANELRQCDSLCSG